jgi:hypothetical protein
MHALLVRTSQDHDPWHTLFVKVLRVNYLLMPSAQRVPLQSCVQNEDLFSDIYAKGRRQTNHSSVTYPM